MNVELALNTDKTTLGPDACGHTDDSRIRHSFSSSIEVAMQSSPMYTQTRTSYQLLDRPRKAILAQEFVGKPVNTLRTPAMIIDRKLFAENCAAMHHKSKTWGANFRAHLKTHKV